MTQAPPAEALPAPFRAFIRRWFNWLVLVAMAGAGALLSVLIGWTVPFPVAVIVAGVFLYGFAALGDGRMVFQANDSTNGLELWVTDGTEAGTVLVKAPQSRGKAKFVSTATGSGGAGASIGASR